MTMYYFQAGTKRVSATLAKRCDKIARKHGASFTSVELPDGPRYWFETWNRGAPFDGQVRDAVLAALKAAKIELP